MAMAFADNLVLLRDSWDDMCSNIKILETFCELVSPHRGKSVMAFTSSQQKTLIPSMIVLPGYQVAPPLT